MRSGLLRHKLIIQKTTQTISSIGEAVDAWTSFDEVYGSREGGSSSTEELESGGILTMRMESITVRYRAGITEKLRILSRSEHTTLGAAISTTDGTSVTISSAAALPLEGEYRILVEDELMKVTAGQGTTTLTVTRGVDGTTGATHSNSTSLHRMDVIDIESVTDPDGRRTEMLIEGVVHG